MFSITKSWIFSLQFKTHSQNVYFEECISVHENMRMETSLSQLVDQQNFRHNKQNKT